MANENTSDIFEFKISLKDIKPPIWRRVQVPANYTFHQMHNVIQSSMGWLNYHLYMFTMKNSPKVDIGIPDQYNEDILPSKSILLSEYFRRVKDKATYLYDFGDDWEHTIVLEKIIPRILVEKYPKCIAGKRACPPEDCGGSDGYEDHIKIVNDPQNPEYEAHMKWVDSQRAQRDPEFFDHTSVNLSDSQV